MSFIQAHWEIRFTYPTPRIKMRGRRIRLIGSLDARFIRNNFKIIIMNIFNKTDEKMEVVIGDVESMKKN